MDNVCMRCLLKPLQEKEEEILFQAPSQWAGDEKGNVKHEIIISLVERTRVRKGSQGQPSLPSFLTEDERSKMYLLGGGRRQTTDFSTLSLLKERCAGRDWGSAEGRYPPSLTLCLGKA